MFLRGATACWRARADRGTRGAASAERGRRRPGARKRHEGRRGFGASSA
jgi:hypothetical protein